LTRLDVSNKIDAMSRAPSASAALVTGLIPSAAMRALLVSMLLGTVTVVLIWGLRGVT
jgi:hypothetical protein